MSDEKKIAKPSKTQKTDTQKERANESTPKFNSVVHPKGKKLKQEIKGISRASAVLLAFLSSLIGGAIGWGGPILFDRVDETANLRTEMQAAMGSANTQAQSDREVLQSLRKTIRQQAERTQQLETNGRALLDMQTGQLKTLGEINTKLEQYPEKTNQIAALQERLNVLEAGIGDGKGDAKGVQAILDRFNALEREQKRMADLLTAFDANEMIAEQDEKAKEALPEAFQKPEQTTDAEYDKSEILKNLVETFPRAKMLGAVRVQEDLASKKPSWLQRTLSKHVKIRDEEMPAPLITVNAAEAALQKGQIKQALDEIAKLNPPVRAAAADWVNAAKKAVKMFENKDKSKEL